MWNIDFNYFHTHTLSTKPAQILYANAYEFKKPEIMFPICYIGMNAALWREILHPFLKIYYENENENNNFEQSMQNEWPIHQILIDVLENAKQTIGAYKWDHSGKAISPQV